MTRALFLRLLLAFALAWSGSAAQLHALAHAQHDLAAAGAGDKAPAPLKHSTDQCLVLHALDGAAADIGPKLSFEAFSQAALSPLIERRGAAPLLAFRSRAPPVLS